MQSIDLTRFAVGILAAFPFGLRSVGGKSYLWDVSPVHLIFCSAWWVPASGAAIAVLFLTHHVWNHGKIWSHFLLRFGEAARSLHSHPLHLPQDRNSRRGWHSVQFMVHVGALGVLGMVHALFVNPSMQQLVQLMFMSGVYFSHHLVCKGKLELNAANLRTIYILFYSSFVLFVLANPSGENGRAVITKGFNVCSRMLMSVIFMDTRTAIPAQLVLLVAETGVHAIQHTLSESVLFAWMQTLVSSSIIAFSCVLEFWVTSHISVLLESSGHRVNGIQFPHVFG